MKRIQPITLSQLIWIGFLLVALPLGGAIVTATIQVAGFAQDNRKALVSVQENASTSRALADRTSELERTARQYQILEDAEYKALYDEHRTEVRAMLARLVEENSNSKLLDRLARAEKSELAANRVVESIGTNAKASDVENAFTALRDDVVAVVQAHNAAVRELGASMPAKASALQRIMVGQAALVIPLSLGLAVLFGVLIARPVRQLDQAIRLLGRGALAEPVQVQGTRDLEDLGLRLDWLRMRLVELETQKAHFLRNVSHELKTPLTNIREGAELLLDDLGEVVTETENASITRILRDNSVRLQQMIEELLRYGADGDLMTDEQRKAVRLDRLVDDVLEQYRLALTARSVDLKASLTPAIVEGSPKRLRVVIDNLVSNAVKYTPSGGHVRVALNSTLDEITLDVEDSGPGIRKLDAPHLFDWFYTGPRPPDAVLGATGMGLAIAQEYAEQLGGHIQLIESSTGAHFRLRLQGIQHDQA